MPDRPQNRRSKLISDQAADWLVILDSGDMSDEEKLGYVRWLKQSPAHVRAILELMNLKELLKETNMGGVEMPPAPDIPADATNVVALPPSVPRQQEDPVEEPAENEK
jgi:ferric-dicitrate binding protein FerR (iron transport regulator)